MIAAAAAELTSYPPCRRLSCRHYYALHVRPAPATLASCNCFVRLTIRSHTDASTQLHTHSFSFFVADCCPLPTGIGYIAFAWMACTSAIEKVTPTQHTSPSLARPLSHSVPPSLPSLPLFLYNFTAFSVLQASVTLPSHGWPAPVPWRRSLTHNAHPTFLPPLSLSIISVVFQTSSLLQALGTLPLHGWPAPVP